MSIPTRIQLIPASGPELGPEARWSDDRPRVVGRVKGECAIVVPRPGISRAHCRIEKTAEGYRVQDLQSTNGTFVNRVAVTGSRDLADGDELGLGRFTLRVSIGPVTQEIEIPTFTV